MQDGCLLAPTLSINAIVQWMQPCPVDVQKGGAQFIINAKLSHRLRPDERDPYGVY